jgi:hypothetical protein
MLTAAWSDLRYRRDARRAADAGKAALTLVRTAAIERTRRLTRRHDGAGGSAVRCFRDPGWSAVVMAVSSRVSAQAKASAGRGYSMDEPGHTDESGVARSSEPANRSPKTGG